ncbi:uncharacterized protein LOC113340833 [Papaver somniferum]|uniref:uncharacterized protein LOC113340833 n=1 Tax=Papaver somniferum TaxID=3469 RepID=UPI000E6FBFDB|nr:uncharacterized protein LOC113340833 [Papaver somniferum]
MEHDLIEEGELAEKEYFHVTHEVPAAMGFLGKDTRDYLQHLNKLYSSDIIFLSETKINDDRIIRLSNFLGFPNKSYVPSIGLAGGIFLLWKDGLTLDLVGSTDKMIHVIVSNDPSKGEWFLSCVYDRNSQSPNSTPQEVLGAINDSGLSDLRFSGNPFTWSSTGRNWKFWEHWLQNNQCHDEIKNAWSAYYHGSNAFVLANKEFYTRHCLSKWSKAVFGGIEGRIINLQSHITQLQISDKDGSNTNEVTTLEKEISSLNDILASSNRQKARDIFFNDMDKNSKYFHIRANKRRSRNRIDALQSPNGTWCSDKASLEDLLSNHFHKIMSTSSPGSSYYFLKHIPSIITDAVNQELEAIPSEEEIYKALMTMEPWTSPGPDGFPPGFHQTQWSIVKDDVCNMVKSFFPLRLHAQGAK